MTATALHEIETSEGDDGTTHSVEGAVPIIAIRHPAAPATAAGLPNPDQGAPATWVA